MRYLPVFLDLQSGKVLLVGAGDLVRAKLRLLVSAGARVRWYSTDGDHDLAGIDANDRARIELAAGDHFRAAVHRHLLALKQHVRVQAQRLAQCVAEAEAGLRGCREDRAGFG